MTTGRVYLVGAGPGDPGLLTLRGRQCLERADAVVYDDLANRHLLAHAPRAEHIYVGKRPDRHHLDQADINRVLVDLARRVQRVVRLKGGDPFVFGRGGEEALALAEAGVPFEVVPGVTAGIAAPAYAGIPVTHRGVAGSFTLITGHAATDGSGLAIDLDRIAREGTLAFYMAVRTLPAICAELQRLGRAPDTPAAAVEWGTYPRQRTIRADLATLAERCAAAGLGSPAVVVIGPVAALHDRLAWFEQRPLFGKRVVVTRSRTQASELVRTLRELGADVFEFPTIKVERPDEPEPFDPIGTYDWVVFTSVNGVDMLFQRLAEQGADARDLHGVRLCAIGSATADAIRQRFLNVDLMPGRYVAEELMRALETQVGDLAGKRFLLPRADIARSMLPDALRERGAEVTELVAYRTVAPEASDERARALVDYDPDLLTFTSSSTARNLRAMIGAERFAALGRRAAVACIGPVTAETAGKLGLEVAIQPEQHDIPNLVAAIVAWARGE